ncbi:hypothetical protein B0T19DRAFT_146094 [Cercophora scortea]|uniref:C2H2-type domain-containing protein n=1 Tax=Cercophora scortea TaxID=314031 RepID=A0AAE0IZJ0_9PEZI|nr:hypothetical protein B0T19DRAFT_146094 [Cercophora scortea]
MADTTLNSDLQSAAELNMEHTEHSAEISEVSRSLSSAPCRETPSRSPPMDTGSPPNHSALSGDTLGGTNPEAFGDFAHFFEIYQNSGAEIVMEELQQSACPLIDLDLSPESHSLASDTLQRALVRGLNNIRKRWLTGDDGPTPTGTPLLGPQGPQVRVHDGDWQEVPGPDSAETFGFDDVSGFTLMDLDTEEDQPRKEEKKEEIKEQGEHRGGDEDIQGLADSCTYQPALLEDLTEPQDDTHQDSAVPPAATNQAIGSSVPSPRPGSSQSDNNLARAHHEPISDEQQAARVETGHYGNRRSLFMQVGLAKIRVELLSISRMGKDDVSETSAPSRDDDGSEDDDGNVDDEELRDKGTEGDSSTNSSGASGNPAASQTPESRPVSRTPPTTNKRNGDQNEGRKDQEKRRRLGSRRPNKAFNQGRFACPYQVFEPSMDCLQLSTRNKAGGCDGIARLRQHLSRKHMLSYRCLTCWRSFDTKPALQDHIHQAECQPGPRPEKERFMSNEQEEGIETMSALGSAEDTWWSLFQLLITDPQARSLDVLKSDYFPAPYYRCTDYLARNWSFSIPSLVFPDVSFQPQPTPSLVGVDHTNLSSMGFSVPPTLATESTMSTTASYPSHTLDIPIYETGHIDFQGLLDNTNHETEAVDTGTNAVANLSRLAFSSHSSTPADTMPEPPSSAPTNTLLSFSTPGSLSRHLSSTPGSRSPNIQSQKQQNMERMRIRSQRAVAEAEGFREANTRNRADVRRADAILEDVLRSEDLPSGMYEKLSQISDILSLLEERMK